MPAVADLLRGGSALTDRLSVGRRAVATDDLDTRMLAQPVGQRGGLTVGQHIDPLVGDRVEKQRGVAAPAT
jgi:hypothetical protein